MICSSFLKLIYSSFKISTATDSLSPAKKVLKLHPFYPSLSFNFVWFLSVCMLSNLYIFCYSVHVMLWIQNVPQYCHMCVRWLHHEGDTSSVDSPMSSVTKYAARRWSLARGGSLIGRVCSCVKLLPISLPVFWLPYNEQQSSAQALVPWHFCLPLPSPPLSFLFLFSFPFPSLFLSVPPSIPFFSSLFKNYREGL